MRVCVSVCSCWNFTMELQLNNRTRLSHTRTQQGVKQHHMAVWPDKQNSVLNINVSSGSGKSRGIRGDYSVFEKRLEVGKMLNLLPIVNVWWNETHHVSGVRRLSTDDAFCILKAHWTAQSKSSVLPPSVHCSLHVHCFVIRRWENVISRNFGCCSLCSFPMAQWHNNALYVLSISISRYVLPDTYTNTHQKWTDSSICE